MILEWLFKNTNRKINNKIYNLRKIEKYVSFKTAVQIHKQTILPVLDYGCLLFL